MPDAWPSGFDFSCIVLFAFHIIPIATTNQTSRTYFEEIKYCLKSETKCKFIYS